MKRKEIPQTIMEYMRALKRILKRQVCMDIQVQCQARIDIIITYGEWRDLSR
jgi:hypothetical protein